MKKKTIAGICVLSALVVAGGGFGIYKLVKSNASPVEVTSVSTLNTGWWGNSMPTSGMITADASQEVHLDSDQIVDKVYVKEGDKVKIGDKLLSYDSTLLELDLESAKLDQKAVELNIKAAEQELEKLKNTTPVSDNYDSGSQMGQNPTGDDDDDEASAKDAVLMRNAAVMTATSQSEMAVEPTTEPKTEPKTEPTTEPQTETPASEPEPSTDTIIDGDEPDETEQTEESPLDQIKPYKKLNFKSNPYKGTGTKDDPYVFFCVDGTTIEASFMNKMVGFNESGTSKKDGGMRGDGEGSYAVLEIREGDSVTGGFVKSISINGTIKADKPYSPDITWTFTSEGVIKNIPEVDEPSEKPDTPDWDGDAWGDGFGDEVYTESELKAAIKEKEDDIKDLKLDLKEAKLKVGQAQKKMDEATVKATINGVVKTVGDPAVGELEDEGFITVTSNEGLYVTGTISELKLGKVQVGTTMSGTSYDSGISFDAEITEISEYPSTSDMFGSSDGSNASQYPFMAYIADSEGLSNNEYVELNIQEDSAVNGSSVYLYKAYIRSENGQSYVYKADENNRLVKQYIKTGVTVYSTAVEVKAGITLEDKIAFPYGKNVVEGAKVIDKNADDSDSEIAY